MQLDQDLPALDDLGVIEDDEVDLGRAVADSFEAELTLDVDDQPASASAPAAADLGDVIELTQEDEENIKEKLTEAEVFVRYGLVDKAIAQLLDVLESFRFHTESREKLIEIYKDQGMSGEASEQLMQLSQVYDKLERRDESVQAREEATQLNPSLAAQEELELTLSPETDSDLGDVDIDLGAPAVAPEVAIPVAEAAPPVAEAPVEEEIDIVVDDAPEIVISLEESAVEVSVDIEEEIPVEVDLGAADVDIASSDIDLGVVAELEEPEAPTVEPDEPSLDLGDADGLEIEIDLDVSSDEISFDVAGDAGDVVVEEDAAAPVETIGLGEALGEELDISIEPDEPDAADEEFSLEMPVEPPAAPELPEIPEIPEIEDEIVSPDLGGPADASDDIEIDIPSAPRPAQPRQAASPLAAELEEVDEYIALGLYEDAQDTLGELLKQHPGNQDVLAKIEELGFSAEQVQKGHAAPAKAPTFVIPVAPEPVQDESPPQAEFVPTAPPVDDEPDPLAAALSDAPLTDDEIGIEALVDAPSRRSRRGLEPPHPGSSSSISRPSSRTRSSGPRASSTRKRTSQKARSPIPVSIRSSRSSVRASKNSSGRKTTTPATISGSPTRRWGFSTRRSQSSSSRRKTSSGGSSVAACLGCALWRRACRTSLSNGSPRVSRFPAAGMRSTTAFDTTSRRRTSCTWKSSKTTPGSGT